MFPCQLRPALPGCVGPASIPTETFLAIIEAFLTDARNSARTIEWRLESATNTTSNFRLALTGDMGYPEPLSIQRFRQISLPLQINKKCRELTSLVFIPVPSKPFYFTRTGPDIFVLPDVDLFRLPTIGKGDKELLNSLFLSTFAVHTFMQHIRRFHILVFNRTNLGTIESLPQLEEVIFNGKNLIDTTEMSDTQCVLDVIPMKPNDFPEWSNDQSPPKKTSFGSFWYLFSYRSIRVYGTVLDSRLSTFEVYNTSDDPTEESPSIKFLEPECTCSKCLIATQDDNRRETGPVGPSSLPSGLSLAIIDILITEAVQSARPIFWDTVDLTRSPVRLSVKQANKKKMAHEVLKRYASFRLPSQINSKTLKMVGQQLCRANMETHYIGYDDGYAYMYGWALPSIDTFPIDVECFRTTGEGIRLFLSDWKSNSTSRLGSAGVKYE
ncbi:hypothetical protein CSAL01_07509 [Colletotrichum salicis]|uniref:Uncharacterized protein n=1 Tax=Colletotrichum salicis TaxID=1209931 RepID=A0A135SW44_9PEZI|nr:hypothetical protein CSAL01_07509 [Colletotrichum salicis]